MLVEVAKRLRAVSRLDDLVIRQGGEEFVMLLKVQGAEELMAIAERIRAQFQRTPFAIGASIRNVTLSAGCALLAPAESLAELLKRADAALYRAKQAGRNRVVLADGRIG